MRTDEEVILMNYVSFDRHDADYGSVAELGYYALVEVGGVEEQRYVAEAAPEDELDWLEEGWYIYKEDNQGFIYVLGPYGKDEAAVHWQGVEKMYDDWYLEVKGYGTEDVLAAMSQW